MSNNILLDIIKFLLMSPYLLVSCQQIGKSNHQNHLEFIIYNTTYLPAIRRNYTKFRDFYRKGEAWTRDNWNLLQFPDIIFLNTVAGFANTTLISPAELPSTDKLRSYPEIQMQTSDKFLGVLRTYTNDLYNLARKIPRDLHLILYDFEDISFANCAAEHK